MSHRSGRLALVSGEMRGGIGGGRPALAAAAPEVVTTRYAARRGARPLHLEGEHRPGVRPGTAPAEGLLSHLDPRMSWATRWRAWCARRWRGTIRAAAGAGSGGEVQAARAYHHGGRRTRPAPLRRRLSEAATPRLRRVRPPPPEGRRQSLVPVLANAAPPWQPALAAPASGAYQDAVPLTAPDAPAELQCPTGTAPDGAYAAATAPIPPPATFAVGTPVARLAWRSRRRSRHSAYLTAGRPAQQRRPQPALLPTPLPAPPAHYRGCPALHLATRRRTLRVSRSNTESRYQTTWPLPIWMLTITQRLGLGEA